MMDRLRESGKSRDPCGNPGNAGILQGINANGLLLLGLSLLLAEARAVAVAALLGVEIVESSTLPAYSFIEIPIRRNLVELGVG
jgi:hypothetical protein